LRKADERLEFHASKLSDSYTSLGGQMNVYLYFPHFLIGTGNLHVMRVSPCEYHENRHSKSHTLLQDVNAAYRNFLRFPSYLQFDTEKKKKKKIFSDFGLGENRPRENHTLLKGVNEFSSARSTFFARFC
jgi:hypothetical protein